MEMIIGVTSGLIAKMAVNLLVSMTAPGHWWTTAAPNRKERESQNNNK